MRTETDGSEQRRKQRLALKRLRNIHPHPSKDRFLISWDAKSKVLRFGCGHGEQAVFVDSSRESEKAVTGECSSRLTPACAERFIIGGDRVEGEQLLDRCQKFVRLYAHLRDERLYSLFAVWSIGTYLYPMFSHFGYLFLHSQAPRSGKTRIEEILSHLCFEATVPLNAPTVPTIREMAAQGRTLVLDTLERWKEKSREAYGAAMELLDAGFRNGGTVAKMGKTTDGKWRKEMFPVYAPYVLAGIGRDSLTDTALDRAFAIEMHRKSIAVKKKKYSFPICEQECQLLRDELYRWALENAASLAAVYESAELEADVEALELNDRAADIWKPLLAIARVMASGEAWQVLRSLAVEMCHDPEATERAQTSAIARSLRKLVNGSGGAVGMTSEFVSHLRSDGLDVDEHELHRVLTQWGFFQESVRLEQGPRRAWTLQDARLEEIERENGGIPPVEM